MNAFNRLAALPPTISTKAELLQRLGQRAKPRPEHVCIPKSAEFSELNSLMAASNEDRIVRLREALARASSRLEHDQAQSRLAGYARSQFERER